MRKIFVMLLAVAMLLLVAPTAVMAAEPDYATQIGNGVLYLENDSNAVNIDLHENTDLFVFVVMGSETLETVNLSGCTNLSMVVIIDAPELTSVDLSGCTGLNSGKGVKIVGAPSLTAVNVTKCSSLPLLYLMFCPEITTLAGLEDCEGLTDLRINGSITTKLPLLDLSTCTDLAVIKLAHDIDFTLPEGKELTNDSADSSKVLYHKMYFTVGTDSTSAQSITAIKNGAGASFDLKSLIGADDYHTVPGNIAYLNGVGTVIDKKTGEASPYEAIPVEKGSNGFVSFPTNSDYLEWCIQRNDYVEDHVVSVNYADSVSKTDVTKVVANDGKTVDLSNPSVVLVPTGEIKEKDALPPKEVEVIENKLPTGAEAEMWLDLNVLVVDTDNGNEELGKVSQVNGKIKFSIDLPADVLTAVNRSRYVYVARSHDGVVDFLNVAIEDGRAIFETDRFSTYALVVSDVKLVPTHSRHGAAVTTAAVPSAQTADCGILLYGTLCASSLLGMGWVVKKK